MNKDVAPKNAAETAQRLFELEVQVAEIEEKAVLADILFRWWESQQGHIPPMSTVSLWRLTDRAMKDYLGWNAEENDAK